MYKVVHSTGYPLINAGEMVPGNPIKTLVSKEKRRYKEGGYDLDLTCIPPSSIVSVFMFVCGAFVGDLLCCMDTFQT